MATATETAPTALGQLFPIGQLVPSKLNPRKKFDDASLADLASNIQKRGEVIVPLILRTKGDRFEIIDGERRFRASKKAGNITELPAILKDDLTDSEVIEIMLLSAIQRQELTPLEEASGYKALIDSNPSHYSALYIADRIGRSEKYVWDTMKLLDLVDEAKALLEREKMQVGHAKVLAKLKPEDQTRTIDPENGGLFTRVTRLNFDEDEKEPADKYRAYKPVTVAELQAWIQDHVRFDVQHAAAAAPLDFGPAAQRVEEATTKPGRGKKVVAITYDSFVQPSAKNDERTYGPRSWKRADGSKGTTVIEYPRRKVMDSPTCEHSVLGQVVVGDGWGEQFEVCLAKEKCEIHWGAEIKEREKNQKLRNAGKGSQAAQRESATEDRYRQEEAAREAKRQLWQTIVSPLVDEAIRQVKGTTKLNARHVAYIEKKGLGQVQASDVKELVKVLGKSWHRNLPAALLVLAVANVNTYWGAFEEYVRDVAKPLGLDIKALDAVRVKHSPKPKAETKPETAKKAAPANANKTAKKGRK